MLNKNKHPMNVKTSQKNHDVTVAFVIFIFCLLVALFSNFNGF
jgi:hypothetical protein